MKGWIILATSLIINTISSHSSVAGIFNPSTTTLSNGLQIVLVQNHLAPIVSVSLIYKVGTADDPTEMHGLSHFLEHMMFKGTKEIPADQFKRIISSSGGTINAFTTPDLTAYTCDIALEFFDSYLKLEADRMQNLVIGNKEVIAEKKVVQEERLMRLDNNPFGVAYEALLRANYWYHPYGIPAIGYPQHIEAYTRDAAYAHYKKWYAPNNAIMIVAGDINMETLKAMVEKHFGNIPSRPLPPRERIKEPDHSNITITLEQENPRISQVSVNLNYASPSHRGPNNEHYYPLIILAQVLGGNDISRLYRALVQDLKVAVHASSYYDNDGYDPQTFDISAVLAPNAELVSLKAAIDKQIELILKSGITESELADAKRDILADLAFARDGNSSSVSTFTRMAVGFTVEQIENWPNQINAVTLTQVHNAAKFVLSKNPISIMTVYPLGYKERAKKAEANCILSTNQNDKEKDDLKKTAQKGG